MMGKCNGRTWTHWPPPRLLTFYSLDPPPIFASPTDRLFLCVSSSIERAVASILVVSRIHVSASRSCKPRLRLLSQTSRAIAPGCCSKEQCFKDICWPPRSRSDLLSHNRRSLETLERRMRRHHMLLTATGPFTMSLWAKPLTTSM